jgi:hypothetical protein
MWSFFQ